MSDVLTVYENIRIRNRLVSGVGQDWLIDEVKRLRALLQIRWREIGHLERRLLDAEGGVVI